MSFRRAKDNINAWKIFFEHHLQKKTLASLRKNFDLCQTICEFLYLRRVKILYIKFLSFLRKVIYWRRTNNVFQRSLPKKCEIPSKNFLSCVDIFWIFHLLLISQNARSRYFHIIRGSRHTAKLTREFRIDYVSFITCYMKEKKKSIGKTWHDSVSCIITISTTPATVLLTNLITSVEDA